MTKNLKGGYKIVSLKGNDLTSESAFTVKGLYEDLADSYSKPILVSEIVIDGVKEQDAYAVVKKTESGYTIEVYDYALTVTDEDSVTSTAKPVITSIGDGLTLTDGELSASDGGGSVYLHSVFVNGKYNGNDYTLYLNVYSSEANPYENLKALITDLYNKASSHEYSSNLVISGGYVNNVYPAYMEIPTTEPSTTFGVGYFPDGKTNNLSPVTFASITTFRDIVIGA